MFKWMGRVTLWIVFLPVGLWRSIRHGRNKRQAEVLTAIEKTRLDQEAAIRDLELQNARLDAAQFQAQLP